MNKTLTRIVMSAAVVLGLGRVGCSRYVLTQEQADKMNSWAVFENTEDVAKYLALKQRIEDSDVDGAKRLLNLYLREEENELNNVLAYVNKNQQISEESKKELIELIDSYIKKTKEEKRK
ncbi:hypothetical protein HYX16_01110 [Candidatus Woesearchaeota archaeon]|nr:hypothetical protein [Candidatus Woesearchaeota archaeon]